MALVEALHEVVVQQVELLFDTLQHLVALDIRVYFPVNQDQLAFGLTGVFAFQFGSHLHDFRLDFGQHFALAGEVYHQVDHLLTFVLQVMLQFFFLQLYDLLFMLGFRSFIFLLHFLYFLVFLHYGLPLLAAHAGGVPANQRPRQGY